jgi:bifunctional DNA-binding transcriptional regulator/antitoxin component of YhaV-PrlF toxin-antitoxin module
MMKSTGIVRKVDELGRVVIPIELRRTLGTSLHVSSVVMQRTFLILKVKLFVTFVYQKCQHL